MVNLNAEALNESQTCPAVGYQSASICVPVTVTPYAQTGGVKNGSCFFTITQDICVAVPVEFGAVATVGDSYVNCNGASEEDICAACGVVPTLPEVETPQA